jgi:phage shock protein PspC (stress-responsive transcriptional regulator)
MNETPPGQSGGGPTLEPGTADDQSRDRSGHGPSGEHPEGIDTDHLTDYRALRREVTERKIAGVCGGLARHLDLDPTLVRVVMVVLALFGGAGLVLYAALWLFVPEQGRDTGLVPVGEGTRNAVIVIALVLALLVALPAGFDGDGGLAVPVIVAGVLLAAVLMSRDSSRTPAGAAGAAGGGAPGHRAPGGGPLVPPPKAPTTGFVPPPVPSRRGPLLLGFALASVALALGVLGLVDATGVAVADAAYPALALAVVGGWLVVGSLFGRPGGLVGLGVLALIALSVTTLVEPTFEGERELEVRPTTVNELDASYDVPAGRAEIDLSGISDVESLDGRTLAVDVNAGEIVLVVPEGLAVALEAQVSAGGEVATPDGTRGGWGVEVDQVLEADDSRATLRADLNVGFGRILVRSES